MANKKLAIIIPTKDHLSLLIGLVNSIIYHSGYDRNLMTLYIADTGSKDIIRKAEGKYMDFVRERYDIQSRIIDYGYYNFAKINNDVVKNHIDKDTDLILLCNNDIELINDAISILVDEYGKEDVGTLGARLMYRQNTVQHCGIILKNGLFPTHFLLNKPFPKEYDGAKAKTYGNTGAFMLTSLKIWNEIGGLNEDYVSCFEDVEYNLRCMLAGHTNYTLFGAICYHFESQTRDKKVNNDDRKKILSFIKDEFRHETADKEEKQREAGSEEETGLHEEA